LAAGPALAAIPEVRGLMDVSDGLARDLPRFLRPAEPGTRPLGADLRLAEGDLHAETAAAARLFGRAPAEWAVLGGEDYVLLGCCPPDAFGRVRAAVPSALGIGTVVPGPGLRLNGTLLEERGFDHFAG
jgi:thiamine-monophosphate kinase